MDKWKELLWKLLFPHTILIFLLFNVSVLLLLYAFWGKHCPEPVAYISYGVSAYTLTIVCARVPGIIKKVLPCARWSWGSSSSQSGCLQWQEMIKF